VVSIISIIIPTYNEAENIKKLTRKIYKSMKDYSYELIIVDDNSPDNTVKIARNLPKKYKVRVLLRKKDKGLSKSIVDGFKIAKGNILGVMDADFAHPIKQIPRILNKMNKENADIAVGSRSIKGGKIKNWPLQRRIISKIATLLAKPLTEIKDPMSGFFFIKKKVIKNISLKPKGYKILLEILIKGNYKKTEEIPILFKDRIKGTSKLTTKIYLEYLMQLFELYFYKIKKYSKIYNIEKNN
jgi:dolichol-phosphate mannosyltransferase